MSKKQMTHSVATLFHIHFYAVWEIAIEPVKIWHIVELLLWLGEMSFYLRIIYFFHSQPHITLKNWFFMYFSKLNFEKLVIAIYHRHKKKKNKKTTQEHTIGAYNWKLQFKWYEHPSSYLLISKSTVSGRNSFFTICC